MSKYLIFRPMEDKPKTKVFAVVSKNDVNQRLGVVKWYGSWRQYCFFPDEETVWNIDCLNDIIYFTKSLTDEHRRKKR